MSKTVKLKQSRMTGSREIPLQLQALPIKADGNTENWKGTLPRAANAKCTMTAKGCDRV